MAEAPILAGRLASHPLAPAFATEVARVHRRYATEVVAAFALCPFMSDPVSAFGRFCVVLDRDPELETAVAHATVEPGVVHLVYPLARCDVATFERFGSSVHEGARREAAKLERSVLPVHATFHPEMSGDRSTAAKRVALVRRAPDPFVQLVPEGLMQGGGTAFVDVSKLDLASLSSQPAAPRKKTLARLDDAELDALEARIADIVADRRESYARFLHALA